MTVYWLTTFISYFFAKAYEWAQARRRRKGFSSRFFERALFVFSALTMIVVTGFRYQVGADYTPYEAYFYNVAITGSQGRFEIGYYLLNLFVAQFTTNPRVMFVVCAAVFYTFCYAAISRLSSDVSLSVFLIIGCGYFFSFMNGTRQLIAAAIILFALTTIGKRKNIPFLLLVALAATFHLSAIVCVIIPLLRCVKLNGWSIAVIAFVCIAFSTVADTYALQLAELLGYGDYLTQGTFKAKAGYVQVAINACILVFAVAMYYKGQRKDSFLELLIFMQIITLFLAAMAGSVALIQRIQLFFGMQQVLLIPRALDAIDDKRGRWLFRCGLIAVYLVYIYVTVGLWNSNVVLPYKWSL